MGKVAIYIDYDNLYITLDKYYQKTNMSVLKIDLISKIKEIFKEDKILTVKAFADFEKINTLLSDLQKEQVELRHVYSSKTKKNASDIALTISIMKSIYSNQNIDKYVIVSSDSDMLPIINEMMYFDKEIFVIYSEFCSKDGYENYLNKQSYRTIENIMGLHTYEPISEDMILGSMEDFLQAINEKIIEIYNKYNGKGTSTKKDIKDVLYSTFNLCDNDCSIIMDYLFKNNILIETQNNIGRYSKILLNSQYLLDEGFNFSQVITENDYNNRISKNSLTNK